VKLDIRFECKENGEVEMAASGKGTFSSLATAEEVGSALNNLSHILTETPNRNEGWDIGEGYPPNPSKPGGIDTSNMSPEERKRKLDPIRNYNFASVEKRVKEGIAPGECNVITGRPKLPPFMPELKHKDLDSEASKIARQVDDDLHKEYVERRLASMERKALKNLQGPSAEITTPGTATCCGCGESFPRVSKLWNHTCTKPGFQSKEFGRIKEWWEAQHKRSAEEEVSEIPVKTTSEPVVMDPPSRAKLPQGWDPCPHCGSPSRELLNRTCANESCSGQLFDIYTKKEWEKTTRKE
jgi:hypothetical protein